MTEMGYGVAEENLRLRLTAYEKLQELVNGCPELRIRWEEYLEEHETPGEDTDDLFEDWAEAYENETTGESGIWALLCDIINGTEYGWDDVFRYEDCCLYVAATLPANKNSRVITQEDVCHMLSKYLTPLVMKTADVRWYEIRS